MLTAELIAPPGWLKLDFISDLHLQASEPKTLNAWQRYMQTTPADAVFILGDLFEVWVGDDVLQEHGFEYQCAQVIWQTAARVPVFFMHGNRDFLMGAQMMATCHATLLSDPTVLTFQQQLRQQPQQQHYLLTHGDMLCLADTQYLAFRAVVRQPAWQQAQLAKPLLERQAIGKHMRAESQKNHQKNQQHLFEYADVDNATSVVWLQAANATTMIHGHTHKPANHDLGNGFERVVMTDWDVQAAPARAEVLQLSVNGLQRISLVLS